MDEVDTFIPLVVDKIISTLKVSDFNLNLANHFSIIHLSLFYNMYKHMVIVYKSLTYSRSFSNAV